jgi:hypothetical protein
VVEQRQTEALAVKLLGLSSFGRLSTLLRIAKVLSR